MIKINQQKVKKELCERFGLNLTVIKRNGAIVLRLSDLGYGEGFELILKSEWRYLSVDFVHDSFSRPLLKTMENASDSQKELFCSLSEYYISQYSEVKFYINEVEINPCSRLTWGKDWSALNIKIRKFPIVREDMDTNQFEAIVSKMIGDLLNLVITLLPVEENNLEDQSLKGFPEGALTKIEVNKYERSSINRQNCLILNGTLCKVCEFDFELKYGSIGRNYIHVHHTIPVSQLVPGYKVNPGTDLVPLCPNCHAMIHKKNPPYSVEELKEIMMKNIK